jgi:ATP diphosphatase
LGDFLFSCVNAARHLEQDLESLLREVNRKFERRFTSVEKLLVLDGISLADATIEQMNKAWLKVKRAEKILT